MRRALGTAQTSPGWHAWAGRNMDRAAKNRAIKATPIKSGRYGSNTVRFQIQAPLTPNETSTKGPRQQVDARIAASPPQTKPWHSCGLLFSVSTADYP